MHNAAATTCPRPVACRDIDRRGFGGMKRRRNLLFRCFGLVVCLCAPMAVTNEQSDQLVWDYGEFVDGFAAKDWSRISAFVGPETKVGLGGEMGFEGVLKVYDEDEDCHRAMVQSLQLGCRKVGKAENMHCVAPPQLGPDVVYLGSRASFRYNADRERWMAVHLICGGD